MSSEAVAHRRRGFGRRRQAGPPRPSRRCSSPRCWHRSSTAWTPSGLFGGGQGEKIYRSMMVQEYGKAVAKAGGVGIADAVQREILKMQENQQ